MEIFILNTSFQIVAVIDSFESFIWTERYSDYGDFELYLSPNSPVTQYLQVDNYVEIRDSDRTMIIEEVQIDADVDNGHSIKISGRSLESILYRRIVWKQTSISDKTVDEVIKQLLYDNVIEPTDSTRRIDIFEYDELPNEHYIKTLNISQIQFTGDNLFDVVKSICDAFDLGFRIVRSESENTTLHFQLFVGENRSYDNDDGSEQLKNPHVVFSPTFDNLLNSNYFESNKNLKTVTLVAGEGEGADRIMTEVPSVNGAGTGLSRRELFTDARDLSKSTQTQDENGNMTENTLSDDEYNDVLTERGTEKLAEYCATESFEGSIDPSTEYVYGTPESIKMGIADYSIGDTVQVENEYGMGCRCRVTEFIRSEDSSGYETYPTFMKI